MGDARPVLLVHGAWHGAWWWSAAQAALDGMGVSSWAIDLPGHGLSLDPLGDLGTDADSVCSAMRTIERLTGQDVVLVGHSYGGGVITEAAARHLAAGNRPAHLVYVTAAALSDGESVGGLAVAVNGNKTRLSELSQPAGDGTVSVGPRELVTEVFYSRCSARGGQCRMAPAGPSIGEQLRPADRRRPALIYREHVHRLQRRSGVAPGCATPSRRAVHQLGGDRRRSFARDLCS